MKKLIRNFFEDAGVHFRQDEQGKDVFYPWGYPGEAIYISRKSRSYINTSIWSLVFVFGMCAYALSNNTVKSSLGYENKNYIETAASAVFPLTYIGFCYFLSVKNGLYILLESERPKRKFRFLWLLWVIVLYQINTMISVVILHSLSPFILLFFAASISYTIFIAHFILSLKNRNGYFFTNKEVRSA